MNRFWRVLQIVAFCLVCWVVFGGITYLVGSAILAAVRS